MVHLIHNDPPRRSRGHKKAPASVGSTDQGKKGVGEMKKIAFDIPNILESIRADVEAGVLTIEQAAEELYDAGWMNYMDIDEAKRLLIK